MSKKPDSPDDMDSMAENPRDVRIGELLNEFLDQRQSSSPLSAAEFISRHPDYAADLSQHMEGLGLLERLSDGSAPRPVTTLVGTVESARAARRASMGIPSIEGYDVMREIGRGGMGVVYKAVQRSTKRAVAVKVLLEGPLASDATRKRFEREVELAAQLKHPNIIPIYDSGVADDGRLYYAMEYVHGKSLNDHVKERKPSLRDKLRLFMRCCQAVIHAHQRGVIHRDLKPSNVLVDESGEPRIHDFGLAKSGQVTDVQMSMTAQLVGTPAYMSPEQITGEPGGIDTRTDVYALGVILYELLCEQAPYDVKGNIAHVLHNIQHQDPTPPRRLCDDIDDELETIVLKAIAKQRHERYQSVTEFGADIERYLAGEPIQAKPVGIFYLARKMISRHRLQAAIVSLTVIILALGTLLHQTTRQTRQERQQREQMTEKVRLAEEREEVSAEQLAALKEILGKSSKDVQTKLLAEAFKVGLDNMSSERPQTGMQQTLMWMLASLGGAAATQPVDAGAPASQPASQNSATAVEDEPGPADKAKSDRS